MRGGNAQAPRTTESGLQHLEDFFYENRKKAFAPLTGTVAVVERYIRGSFFDFDDNHGAKCRIIDSLIPTLYEFSTVVLDKPKLG